MRPSVLVAVPTYESVAIETVESLMRLMASAHATARIEPAFVKGYDVKKARTAIAEMAMTRHDFVLMVDSDVVVPDGLLDALLNPVADVVLAPYPRKNTKRGRSELFLAGADGWADDANIPIPALRATGGRIPVKGGGLGCALIRTDVFRRIERPWFEFHQNADGSWLSEDFWFCNRVREAGLEIQADCRMICGHVGRSVNYE